MSRKAISHSEGWWSSEHRPAHVLRCTAHLKSTGAQCRREALTGMSVCGQHGGLAPHVQAAAANRIAMSVDDAVKRLHEMIDDPTTPHAVKAKILHDLLDRGGLGAVQKHLVAGADPVELLFQSLLSDPRNFTDPNASPPEMPEDVARYNAEVIDADDFLARPRVITGEVVPALEAAPARPSYGDAPKPEKTKTPKHIRKAMEQLL